MPPLTDATVKETRWFIRQARAPKLRSMREFAEEEIVIPNGPFEGRKFRCDRQPYSGLWFDAVDSGRWNRFAATGPTQSGKTLTCFLIPLLYHLFEVGETTICGLPDMDMAGDKWRKDFLPVIARTRYRDLLPRQGGGSRGGKVESIDFRNGATLKFMSGGGGDKSRAGYTSRVLGISETDGMDESGGGSREADKITQLEARTRAFGARKRVFLECTVSIAEGRTWREYKGGTASRILLPCPHCKAWVLPERQHLTGWQEAESAFDARGVSFFCCPECGERWSDDDRDLAISRGRLLHQGQTIDKACRIKGEAPRTNTLGFRWSAIHNRFQTAGQLGAEEWSAARLARERGEDRDENAEKELCQFVWAIPYEPPDFGMTVLDAGRIMRRTRGYFHGVVPADTLSLTVAVDAHKRGHYWGAVALRPTGYHVVDYGFIETNSDEVGEKHGVLAGLRNLREDVLAGGWKCENGDNFEPDFVWIDSGYLADVVYAFCRESGEHFLPTKGYGETQRINSRRYSTPRGKQTGKLIVGDNFHVSYQEAFRTFLVHVNADHWKLHVQERLAMSANEPGAITLYSSKDPRRHFTFSKHMTAEVLTEEFVPGKGQVRSWNVKSRNNHYLDVMALACCAATYWRSISAHREAHKQQARRPTVEPLSLLRER